MKSHVFAIMIVILACCLVAVPQPATAEPSGVTIRMYSGIEGNLDASHSEDTYDLLLNEGQIFSLFATIDSGDLDLDITVLDPSGNVVGEEAPSILGDGVVVVEGVIPTETGNYQVNIARSGDSAGAYYVAVFPGYSGMMVLDSFDGSTGAMALDWPTYDEPGVYARVQDGEYVVDLEPNIDWVLMANGAPSIADQFVDVYTEVVTKDSFYSVGFAMRINYDGKNISFYSVEFTNEGNWMVSLYQNGGYTTISDLQPSSAIDFSQDSSPRIGVHLEGYTFTLFFNGQVVGQVTDPNQALAEGGTGFLVHSWDVPVTYHYHEMLITVPTVVKPEASTESDNAPFEGVDVGGIFDQATAGKVEDLMPLPFDLNTRAADVSAIGSSVAVNNALK